MLMIILCEIKTNILISSSTDKLIKIWNISKTSLNLLKIIQTSSDNALKLYSLTNNRFICKSDFNIQIYENFEPYTNITVLNETSKIFLFVQ